MMLVSLLVLTAAHADPGDALISVEAPWPLQAASLELVEQRGWKISHEECPIIPGSVLEDQTELRAATIGIDSRTATPFFGRPYVAMDAHVGADLSVDEALDLLIEKQALVAPDFRYAVRKSGDNRALVCVAQRIRGRWIASDPLLDQRLTIHVSQKDDTDTEGIFAALDLLSDGITGRVRLSAFGNTVVRPVDRDFDAVPAREILLELLGSKDGREYVWHLQWDTNGNAVLGLIAVPTDV